MATTDPDTFEYIDVLPTDQAFEGAAQAPAPVRHASTESFRGFDGLWLESTSDFTPAGANISANEVEDHPTLDRMTFSNPLYETDPAALHSTSKTMAIPTTQPSQKTRRTVLLGTLAIVFVGLVAAVLILGFNRNDGDSRGPAPTTSVLGSSQGIGQPTGAPSKQPSAVFPTHSPTQTQPQPPTSVSPIQAPTEQPTPAPTFDPTSLPTALPISATTFDPTSSQPSTQPTPAPQTSNPTTVPTAPTCPPSNPAISCSVRPCSVAFCPVTPTAQCRDVYCGVCAAEFYNHDGTPVLECTVAPSAQPTTPSPTRRPTPTLRCHNALNSVSCSSVPGCLWVNGRCNSQTTTAEPTSAGDYCFSYSTYMICAQHLSSGCVWIDGYCRTRPPTAPTLSPISQAPTSPTRTPSSPPSTLPCTEWDSRGCRACGANIATSRSECTSPCQWQWNFWYHTLGGQPYVCTPPGVLIGRPFLVNGDPRVAEAVDSESQPLSTWSTSDNIDIARVAVPNSTEVRRRLAQYWSSAGAAEHASVAAFSRHSLQLMAIGAPARLVQQAHEAALDEIRHAQLGYTLASRYGGVHIGPGPLDISGALDISPNMGSEVIRLTILEGCIGETVAAVEAQIGSILSQDAVVAEMLRRISADEARHAQLAWEVVLWYAKSKPGERGEIKEQILTGVTKRLSRIGGSSGDDADQVRIFGVLTSPDSEYATMLAVSGVIRPMIARLGNAHDAPDIPDMIATVRARETTATWDMVGPTPQESPETSLKMCMHNI